MPKQPTYHVVELDANDKSTVLRSGLNRKEAQSKLAMLRREFGKFGLRYVMYRDQA